MAEQDTNGDCGPASGDGGVAVPGSLTVVGSSMEPNLGRGWRVRVGPLEGDVGAGDVVVIRGSRVWIVHRVVLVARIGGREVVFHRGDGARKVGRCPVQAVCGRVVEVLEPAERGWGGEVAPGLRRSLWWCRLRCRVSAIVRDWVGRVPGLRGLVERLARRGS